MYHSVVQNVHFNEGLGKEAVGKLGNTTRVRRDWDETKCLSDFVHTYKQIKSAVKKRNSVVVIVAPKEHMLGMPIA